MAADVHANAGDLRRFANNVREFVKATETALVRLNSQFGSVDWNDSQRKKFESELQRSIQQVRASVRAMEGMPTFLNRLATAVDDFNRR